MNTRHLTLILIAALLLIAPAPAAESEDDCIALLKSDAPLYEKARAYLEAKTHKAQTFETFRLQGTPSSILVGRDGILRDVSFGYMDHLEPVIADLLAQTIG